MPKLLIVAASAPEVAPLSDFLNVHFETCGDGCFRKGTLEIFLLLSGIGLMESAANIMEAQFLFQPDFALQVGIAGAYKRDLALGALVSVREEILGDLGAEDKESFLDIFELGLLGADAGLYQSKKLVNSMDTFPFIPDFPGVSGLSVNRAAGGEATISERRVRFDADIESMEGAAFHYVCLKRGIPFLQVRSISNYVEPRDKKNWKIAAAVTSLNVWLQHYIKNFSSDLN
jgi:futalosine hydrolase